ncbi:CotH kinase family protein [Microbacterium sp. T2.11-28]|uniref:CotH kinase family protein n=1 Tax=Microbacterium sp. T2.11-28 TaxID=3041169 RepID=UPI0024778B57|nr:CotH kinase family protein [Microbacterium sp. T2.11-28]CAI9386722.1 hypothetical protein MICABA_00555 [Microbacterium sp. T2.11-28]
MAAPRIARVSVLVGLTALILTGCAAGDDGVDASSGSDAPATSDAAAPELWDSTTVHSVSVSYDETDYDDLIETYLSTGEKIWITASVTIDGQTFDDVGLKLKGNSSLRALSTDADATLSSQRPEDLPWIIRLDKFVDGQNLDGTTELVVRGNSSETSLNEALALDLLEQTGLASEAAIATRFSVDGSAETLRLVIENPGDEWAERELGDVLLYKAEAGGDYSYRGQEASAYEDVFDQEAGEDDLTPLIDFLEWINEASDATFAAELGAHLDVDAFATYLAFQELVDNFDDIDGPGNNSYLSYDRTTGLMTVVTWDLNLAFGASPGGGGMGQVPGDGGGARGEQGDQLREPPAEGDADAQTAADVGGPGRGGGSNILAERFLASDRFQALYAAELERLQAELVDSGDAASILQAWTDTLTAGASDLVPEATIAQESSALATALDGR